MIKYHRKLDQLPDFAYCPPQKRSVQASANDMLLTLFGRLIYLLVAIARVGLVILDAQVVILLSKNSTDKVTTKDKLVKIETRGEEMRIVRKEWNGLLHAFNAEARP